YAARIEQLLAQRAVARAVADAALDRVRQEYTWSAFCERIAVLYQEIAESNRPRSRRFFLFPARKVRRAPDRRSEGTAQEPSLEAPLRPPGCPRTPGSRSASSPQRSAAWPSPASGQT